MSFMATFLFHFVICLHFAHNAFCKRKKNYCVCQNPSGLSIMVVGFGVMPKNASPIWNTTETGSRHPIATFSFSQIKKKKKTPNIWNFNCIWNDKLSSQKMSQFPFICMWPCDWLGLPERLRKSRLSLEVGLSSFSEMQMCVLESTPAYRVTLS